MNKRKLKTIVNLYKDGISCEICISIIMDFMDKENYTNIMKGVYIHSFYEQIFDLKEKV